MLKKEFTKLEKSLHLWLTKNSKKLKYFPHKKKDKSMYNVHWGQRKLLLTEIRFLLDYGHLSKTVVYAGAGPGVHIHCLTKLFPKHKFILYDPVKFDSILSKNPRVKIYTQSKESSGYFTDDDAKKYKGKNILFICDIRISKGRNTDDKINPRAKYGENIEESQVIKDNMMQMKWVQLMNPVKAMLKFRCPYYSPDANLPKKMPHLKGDIYFQPWPGPHSSETRLIPQQNKKTGNYDAQTTYDIEMYQDQLSMYNKKQRIKTYDLSFLDPCLKRSPHDLAYEAWLLHKYLSSTSKDVKAEHIIALMKKITSDIHKGYKRHYPNKSIPYNAKYFNEIFLDGKRNVKPKHRF